MNGNLTNRDEYFKAVVVIARTLAGSIGLIVAVPLTTFVAAFVVKREEKPS